eukprot:CAMPEP_0167741408 /NCGR_PEP_ID=MMETSP0110_2-20121227/843_1 /TAXON_ID=629695 /ORGANISM="Gymnochlora sp., Strain CCMP2014" /LENGTH=211 /DNA_ID=CAMNT_0007625463 /DNA_START=118 /DNA_END=753 /DNA_ORIENTATION=-
MLLDKLHAHLCNKLAHPFLKNTDKTLSTTLGQKPITQQPGHERKTGTFETLQQAQSKSWANCARTLSTMATNKSILQGNVNEILRVYDKNGDGVLDHKELKWAVERDPILGEFLGLDPTNPTQFNEMFAKMDRSGSGNITMTDLETQIKRFNQGRQGEAVSISSISEALSVAVPLMVLGQTNQIQAPPLHDVRGWMAFDITTRDILVENPE